ncbi:MAG: methyltransferase [Planctomycetota bacterium]
MTRDEILGLLRSCQPACVLAAAAELDVFSALRARPESAPELAASRGFHLRGTRILLDALAALGFLEKAGDVYSVPEDVAALLGSLGSGSVLAMVRHQANSLRRWAQLARVVATGRPAERVPSIRGEAADLEAFIEGMHEISAPVAGEIVAELRGIPFRTLLDVGAASGTWTIAFLRMEPNARAILFDLPEVIPMAKERLGREGLLERVEFAGGDYLRDPLPPGADLAWLSAIAHQNSREENRRLFLNTFRALKRGGAVAVRDVVMDPSRTSPAAGALFAVNMLAGTEGGGTYTFDEIREDLEASGFEDVRLLRRDPGMHSIVTAKKP